MTILVTGAAGFIGFHVATALLARGETVVGLDSVNDYYDVSLKRARLALLLPNAQFRFVEGDISDKAVLDALIAAHPDLDRIVHLAAQAGVRYSLEEPRAYIKANIVGHLEILELARNMPRLKHLVYASSSSVYGGSRTLPFGLDDRCDEPQSLYAATKRADELMSFTYSHLYSIPATGLRFFTVYGPWGRPDMAPMLFARAVLEGKPIRLFNNGDMERDFTYIDDVVAGVIAALDRPPEGTPPHRVFNLGNHRTEQLRHFVDVIERSCGRKADIVLASMQPGDVQRTYADIATSRRDLGFEPKTSIEQGIPIFVAWFRRFYGL
ncbi:SDR family NAD(P)-dependent oxidoreductase [Lichenihabitans psoromatis]|uniref:SDR family NAD(P)-dependent oxidoreductase n=1 Tax=Lichenihabitans psoromatis TaxID=2528642 RepID=UPI0010385719|nr:SDR family NAD(P)-dependent oxidoreductase [Lichenihabitans psoromatis]